MLQEQSSYEDSDSEDDWEESEEEQELGAEYEAIGKAIDREMAEFVEKENSHLLYLLVKD